MSVFMQKVDDGLSKLYYRTRSSLIAALNECVEEVKPISNKVCFFDFDCHADTHELPQCDIIGLKSFSFYDDNGNVQLSAFIVCSTMNDLNGLRLSKIIGHVFSRFIGNKAIRILDEVKDDVAAMTTLTGTEVTPMSKSDARMVQYIDMSAVLSIKTQGI
jgi:hypothetical protein